MPLILNETNYIFIEHKCEISFFKIRNRIKRIFRQISPRSKDWCSGSIPSTHHLFQSSSDGSRGSGVKSEGCVIYIACTADCQLFSLTFADSYPLYTGGNVLFITSIYHWVVFEWNVPGIERSKADGLIRWCLHIRISPDN